MDRELVWPPADLDFSLNYGLQAKFKTRSKNVVRLVANDNDYALKYVVAPEDKLVFFEEIIRLLINTGFNFFPRVIPTIENKLYVSGTAGNYVLSEWIAGRKADFRDYDDLISCAKTLGQLHRRTRGCLPGHHNWAERWKSGVASYKQLILQNNYPKRLHRFLSQVIEIGEKTLSLLNNPAIAGSLKQPVVICHNNLAQNKMLITHDSTCCLLDFTRAGPDMPQQDFAQLLSKVLSKDNQDEYLALKVIAAYCHVNLLSQADLGVLLACLYSPPSLWEQAAKLESGNPELINQAQKIIRHDLALEPAVDKLARDLGF